MTYILYIVYHILYIVYCILNIVYCIVYIVYCILYMHSAHCILYVYCILILYMSTGNEDCLWINVFTRDLVVRKSRPVVVWIHGGNFVRGSAAEYEPDYILDEDNIVLVKKNSFIVGFETG